MDIQTTTEALKEISERYELYKDIVKIGLGALIGAMASLTTVFLKNRHEINILKKENEYQNNKHKLEIKVRILEEVIELVNEFYKQDYNFRNKIYKLRFVNKYFRDLTVEQKEKILSNDEEYANSLQSIEGAKRKLDMIGAESVSLIVNKLKDVSNNKRNKILRSHLRIKFDDVEWDEFVKEMKDNNLELRKELNLFFIELK